MFAPDVMEAMRREALARFPNEACGLVVRDAETGIPRFEAYPNLHEQPAAHFRMPAAAAERIAAGEVLAVVHSHTNGRDHPSMMDGQQQIAMDLPWGLVLCDGEWASHPFFWGDAVWETTGMSRPSYEGRMFRWGPTGTDGRGDCYALIRDYYRVEHGLDLPEYGRDDDWEKSDGQLYERGWQENGFAPVNLSDARDGDMVLMCIGGPHGRPNHAGIFKAGGWVLHHRTARISRRERMERWLGATVQLVRPPRPALVRAEAA